MTRLGEIEQKSKLEDFCSVNSRYYDIDGGSLPEVEIVAAHKDMGGASGDDPRIDWWYPPLDGNGSSGWEGGGGGILTRPQTVKLATDLITLFKGTDLSKADLEKLNSVYKQMLEDCTYKALSQLMLNKNYLGGKIMMKPAGSSIGQAAVDRLGNLKFFGSSEIGLENLSHEWIHISQRCLKPEVWVDDETYLSYQGALEFDQAMFSDVIYYLKYNQIDSKNTDLPYHKSWISNLELDDNSKILLAIVFAGWLAPNIKDGKVLDRFVGESTYNELSYYFFNYTRVYKNMGLKYDTRYGLSTLHKMVTAVYEECLK